MKKPLWLGIVMVAVLLLGLAISPVFGGNHDLEKAKQAQERHTDELLAKPGVVGTALGRDENGNAVIQVFTARQGVGGIPDKLDGVAVQVKVTGAFEARDDKGTVHKTPVPIGVSSSNVNSIDFPFCYTGTLGARLVDSGGTGYGLSNNHVYANVNGSNGAGPGSGVIHPGLADSGCTTDNTNSIGTLTAYVPIDFDGGDNLVDAAIASDPAGQVGTHTPEADANGGYEPSTQALLCVDDACGNLLSTPAVQKRGRTTHLTTGTITGVNAIVQVNYGKGKKALFVKQLIVEPGTFSAGGDSGSLVVTDDADAKPVGLLFAGSDSSTIVNRIDLVFSELASNVVGTTVTGLGVDGKAPAAATPGITVSPTAGLVTTEAGGQDSFDVVLDTLPSADVTIALSSSDTTEGTVSPTSLTFTPTNGTTAQTVTVTGVDDTEVDGDVAYTIVTAVAVSDDTDYNGLNPADVSVTNLDDDAPGITVSPTSGLVTTEAGGQDTFNVVLDTLPSADVTIALSSSDTTEGTVSPTSLTFTPTNGTTAQTVTVTGVDDTEVDGDIAYTIVTGAAVSDDTNYNGLDPADVSVTNTDNDASLVVAHVEDIEGKIVGKNKKLKTIIVIHDDGPDGGSPVAKATVSAKLTLPDGEVLTAKGETDDNGVFDPNLRKKAHDGMYTVEVINVEKDGLTYDKCRASDTTPPDQSKIEFTITDGVMGPETVVDDCV